MRSTEVLPARFPWIKTSKKTIRVQETIRRILDNSWHSGSQDEWIVVNPTNGSVLARPEPDAEGYTHTAPGIAFVQFTIFQGRRMPPRLHLHPEDYQRLIVDEERCAVHEECRANPEMGRECAKQGDHRPDDRLLRILAIHRAYKAGDYRKRELARVGATPDDIDRLVAAGWLSRNRAGSVAITPIGRTLCADVRV